MSYAKKFLGKTITVTIDRPLGSKHPKYKKCVYSVNYGYVKGTMAPDGEELDAYVLGVFNPVKEFTGKCIAIIHRLDDDDDKLVVAPKGKKYSDEQISELVEFQEKFFKSKVVRK
jgi:inorganic pyrophosphatase